MISLSSSSNAPMLIPSVALDIPEVLQSIARLLDPKSLATATRVSRYWYSCCSPVLWRSITRQDWILPLFSPRQLYAHADLVRSLEWSSFQAPITPPFHMLNPAPSPSASADSRQKINSTSSTDVNSRHNDDQHQQRQQEHGGVSHREISQAKDETLLNEKFSLVCLSKVVGRCQLLQRLYLLAEGGDGVHVAMISVIRSLVFLQDLRLYANKIVMDQETMRSTTRQLKVMEMIRGLDQLKSLALRGTAFSFQNEDEEEEPCQRKQNGVCNTNNNIDSISPVTEGESNGRSYAASSSPLSTVAPDPLQSKLANHISKPKYAAFPIRNLTLDTPALVNEACLLLFLRQCPLLESLDLPGGLAWEWSDAFVEDLARACPYLSSFSINSSSFPPVPEDRLRALILGLGVVKEADGSMTTTPRLRRFGARSCFVGDSTLNALEESCPDLEVLDISLTRGQSLTKPRLYEYLRHARSLNHLEAEGVWILLQDIHLRCQVQEQGEDGDGEGAHEVHIGHANQEEYDQQQQHHQEEERLSCYGWASRNTLHYLNIGFTSPDRSTRQCCGMYSLLSTLTHLEHLQLSYTCLNLSPECGFHQLKTLTRLRTFSIESCGYAPLTRDILVWMVTNWPKLERISVNLPGSSNERLFRAWLREVHREDVMIESQQSMMLHAPSIFL